MPRANGNEKQCSQCERILPLAQFSKCVSEADGLKYACKECISKYQKKYIANIIADLEKKKVMYEKRKPGITDAKRRKKYGITTEQYNEMFAARDGRCDVCGNRETARWKGKLMELAIDHDHNTGQVRGLVCCSCNRGMGLLKDNPEVLRKAAEYLENTALCNSLFGGLTYRLSTKERKRMAEKDGNHSKTR